MSTSEKQVPSPPSTNSPQKRMADDDDTSRTPKKPKIIYDFLSSFENMSVGFDLNSGIFVVHSVAHVEKTPKITNLVLGDQNGQFARFTCFGEDSDKWKDIPLNTVIDVSNFAWHADEKQKKFSSAVTSDYCGTLSSQSFYEVVVEETAKFHDQFDNENKRVSSLADIQRNNKRFVLRFHSIETRQKKDGQDYQVAKFYTCNFDSVGISFFDKNYDDVKKMFVAGKAYLIEDTAFFQKHTTFYDEWFTCRKDSRFAEVVHPTDDIVLPAITKKAPLITLKELLNKEIIDKTVYRMKAYVWTRPAGDDETVVCDTTKDKNLTLLAPVHHQQMIELERGDEIEFTFRIIQKESRRELMVVSDSLTKTGDNKKIHTANTKFI